MPAEPRSPYQYAVVRVVPHVERGESMNVGVIVLCRSRAFIGAATALDEDRLRAFAPDADLVAIRAHLDAFARIARGDPASGPMARLSVAERFHWLVAPSSTIIQASPVHTGLTDDPAAEVEHLLDALVRAGPAVG